MTAMFAYQSKRKREELNNHINRLEQLISQDRAALTTKEVISKAKTEAFRHEPSENECQNHEEDCYALWKFEHVIRAQMLVSICGYFEYVVNRALNKCGVNQSLTDNGLGATINLLRDLDIVDSKTCNALDRYREVRNVCVHSNSISRKNNPALAIARKDEFFGGLKGMTLKRVLPGEHNGKGTINIGDKDFLPDAMTLHFDTIATVLAYTTEKIKISKDSSL